jgi:hypothetical protein
VLPNGQVLYDLEYSSQLWLYTPSGAPNGSWLPKIASVTQRSQGTYLLTGQQLTGMSEGAAPGDDVSMSTNFPIVRLTGAGKLVYYARSFGWSSTEVQTGSARVTTYFTLPSGIPAGRYKLQVIASGVASQPFNFLVPRANAVQVRQARRMSGNAGVRGLSEA